MTAARPDSADYARIFLEGRPLLDTRAPLEFARGAVPGAVNIPLMTDEERALVGTCYKQEGQDAALALGYRLVAGDVRDARIEAWRRFALEHPEGYLYCFRGGLRSQIVQQWLRDSGVAYPRISGGYKDMRRFFIDTLEARSANARFWLVAGATGSGKTRVVQQLARAVDLEGLAGHRGSAFGHLLDPQPSQIDFENQLALQLLALAQGAGPVILEDEGRLIGRLALPECLRLRMGDAPLLVLEHPLAERVDVVLDDYIVDLGQRYRAAFGDDALTRHRERLLEDLGRTRKRLGAERYARVSERMGAAFDTQARSGAIDGHREWIEILLRDYYDPMYAYQLSRRDGRRLFTGRREEVVAWVREADASHAG